MSKKRTDAAGNEFSYFDGSANLDCRKEWI
jgi:hypothetical protein